MKKVNRKTFLKGVALTTIGLPIAIRSCSSQNFAQNAEGPNLITNKKFEWKMVTTWPPGFPVLGESCTILAELVEKMSAGRLKIKVYGGGELVPALEAFEAVQSGAADMGSGAAYYWAGKAPATQFFASVPFGMNAQQINAWVMTGGGQALWDELYGQFNLVPLLAGNSGVQMGGWFNREINTIDDFKGLKMRMPGLGGKVLERAGGAPVLLAGGEIYTGLERGIIDATEWIGPYHDYKMGFHEIAKYYYSPGWHETGTILEMFINKDSFEKLPKDLQAIVRTAAAYINSWMLSEFETKNSIYLKKLINEKNVDIRKFPEVVLQPLRKYTTEILEELTSKDAFSKKVYASYDNFRKQIASWSDLTEKEYYNNILS